MVSMESVDFGDLTTRGNNGFDAEICTEYRF